MRTAFAAGLWIAVSSMPIVSGRAPYDPPPSGPDFRAAAGAVGPVHARWRGATLQSLGRCDACHAVDGVPGINRLAWTSAAAHPERDPSPPRDDAARVQAGGEVYGSACARCHAATDDPSAAASVTGLSDEQIAALAAFLQRHAVATPPRRERPRPML